MVPFTAPGTCITVAVAAESFGSASTNSGVALTSTLNSFRARNFSASTGTVTSPIAPAFTFTLAPTGKFSPASWTTDSLSAGTAIGNTPVTTGNSPTDTRKKCSGDAMYCRSLTRTV